MSALACLWEIDNLSGYGMRTWRSSLPLGSGIPFLDAGHRSASDGWARSTLTLLLLL